MSQRALSIGEQIRDQCYTDLQLREKLREAGIVVARSKTPPQFKPVVIMGLDYWPKEQVDEWIEIALKQK